MTQEEKKEQTIEEKMAKMEYILAGHVKHRKKLGRRLKQAQKRLEGADRDILKRRFAFETGLIKDELEETKGKEEWARRMLHSLDIEANTKKVVFIDPLDGKKEEHIKLIHFPFKGLKELLA